MKSGSIKSLNYIKKDSRAILHQFMTDYYIFKNLSCNCLLGNSEEGNSEQYEAEVNRQ